jgi:Ca2+-binding RTX toxin-like protein
MRRTLGLAALTLAVVPTTAFASSASVSIQRVFYNASPGEVNQLTISASGGAYTLTDAGASIQAGAGCTGAGNTVTCGAALIRGITVMGGDGGDSLENTTSTPSTLSGGDGADSVTGGSGNDILRGNQGIDTISGGAGDDSIDVRGDRADMVSCGAGTDSVRADATDLVAADCENVDRGGTQSTPPPSGGPAPTPAAGGLLGPEETGRLARGACAAEKMGTPGADRLIGTRLGDSIFGLQGNDVIRGGARDDCLFGGLGGDRLSGNRGNDRLLGDDTGSDVPGRDRLSGNAGNDLLVGGPGRDRMSGGSGNDRLRAGGGRNILKGGAGSDRLTAANGRFDIVNCGRGEDSARVDRMDRVRGCEHVRRVQPG